MCLNKHSKTIQWNIEKKNNMLYVRHVRCLQRTIAVIILQINVVFRLLNSEVYQPIDRYDGMVSLLSDSYKLASGKVCQCKTIQFHYILENSTCELFFAVFPLSIGTSFKQQPDIHAMKNNSYRSHICIKMNRKICFSFLYQKV